jgi:hypothetical protein
MTLFLLCNKGMKSQITCLYHFAKIRFFLDIEKNNTIKNKQHYVYFLSYYNVLTI